MILTFVAGMVCGAGLLIFLIVVNDRSFLEMLLGRYAPESVAESTGPMQPLDTSGRKSVAVGSD